MQLLLPFTERPEENQPGSVPGDNDTPGSRRGILKKTDTNGLVLGVHLSGGAGKSLVHEKY